MIDQSPTVRLIRVRNPVALDEHFASSITLLITLLCPLLALWPAAEPRDILIPAFVIYPFAWLTMIPAVYHGWIGFTVALAQFPIYGVILWRAWQVGRLRRRATWLAAVHGFAVAIWFYFFGMSLFV